MWTPGADGAYSTLTDLGALPRLRRDMRSASRDRSESADGRRSDGSDDGGDLVDVLPAFQPAVPDWLMRTFAAGGPSSRRTIERRARTIERRARTTERRARKARMQARTERRAQLYLQTTPPATTDAGSSSAGRTTKRQKITRSLDALFS